MRLMAGITISGMLSDDFGQLENMRPYEGRFPKHANEIALPLPIAGPSRQRSFQRAW